MIVDGNGGSAHGFQITERLKVYLLKKAAKFFLLAHTRRARPTGALFHVFRSALHWKSRCSKGMQARAWHATMQINSINNPDTA
jgi:hypothetical protein